MLCSDITNKKAKQLTLENQIIDWISLPHHFDINIVRPQHK